MKDLRNHVSMLWLGQDSALSYVHMSYFTVECSATNINEEKKRFIFMNVPSGTAVRLGSVAASVRFSAQVVAFLILGDFIMLHSTKIVTHTFKPPTRKIAPFISGTLESET